MTSFGTIGGGAESAPILVEASDPQTLQDLVNAEIEAIDGQVSLITAITLAGSGDGHMFSVLIETGLVADVDGGLFPFLSGATGTVVRCYLGSDPESLLRAKQAAGVPPPAGGIAPYGITDEQLAGGSKGQQFMGLTVFSAASVPVNGNSPRVRALVTSTQALGAGSTILAFSGIADENLFSLPAAQTVRYDGLSALAAKVEASVSVGLTAAGDFTVDIVTDPLGTPNVLASQKSHVAAGEFDDVTVLGFVTLEPFALAPTLIGIRVTSAAGSVLYATLRVSV